MSTPLSLLTVVAWEGTDGLGCGRSARVRVLLDRLVGWQDGPARIATVARCREPVGDSPASCGGAILRANARRSLAFSSVRSGDLVGQKSATEPFFAGQTLSAEAPRAPVAPAGSPR